MALNLVNMMAVRNSIQRTPCKPDDDEYRRFEQSFPYEPTPDQRLCFDVSGSVEWPITVSLVPSIDDHTTSLYYTTLQLVAADMINSSRPMDRLVCGDVGFGKTEVAIRAIYRAVRSGKQV